MWETNIEQKRDSCPNYEMRFAPEAGLMRVSFGVIGFKKLSSCERFFLPDLVGTRFTFYMVNSFARRSGRAIKKMMPKATKVGADGVVIHMRCFED